MHAGSCQYQPFKVASAVKEQAGKGRGKTSAKMPPKHFAKAPASNVKQHDEDDMSGTPDGVSHLCWVQQGWLCESCESQLEHFW